VDDLVTPNIELTLESSKNKSYYHLYIFFNNGKGLLSYEGSPKRKTRYYFLKLLMSDQTPISYINGIPVANMDELMSNLINGMANVGLNGGGAWPAPMNIPQRPWSEWTPADDAAFRAAMYGNGNGN
jgi:hypothetical protein